MRFAKSFLIKKGCSHYARFSTHYLFARELMEQIEAMTPETRLDPDAVYYGTQGPDVLFFIGFCPRCRGKVATRPARECTVQIPTFFLKRCFGMLRRCLRLGGIRPYPIFMDFVPLCARSSCASLYLCNTIPDHQGTPYLVSQRRCPQSSGI